MPQIGFDQQYKRSTFFDYPKLKLEKNEKARVTVVDAPIAEFVHTLVKIVLENGRPIMKTVPYGRDGTKTKEVPVHEFMGKFLCLGETETMLKSEADPDHCPMCAAYLENSGAIGRPQRRVVFHILKHSTKTGSFEIRQPYQAQVLAWEMPDSRFGKLQDIYQEHGDLRKIDICLGPCTKPDWQEYDISPGATSVLDDPANKQTALAIVKENMAEDLTPLLGRKISAAEVKAKIKEILEQWDRGFGVPSSPVSPVSTKPEVSNGEMDFSGLLGGQKDGQKKEQEDKPSWLPDEPPTLTSLAEDKPVKPSRTDDIPDLDALLGDLR